MALLGRHSFLNRLSLACLALMLTVGCGGPSDGRVTASGTVTLDGTPLPNGSVVLFQEAKSHGVGMVKDGAFDFNEAGGTVGIQPGSYNVSVDSWEVEPGAVDEKGSINAKGKSRIPMKYNSHKTSGLTAEIKAGSNEIELKLVSQ